MNYDDVDEPVIGLFGDPGTGKTSNARMLCHNYAEHWGIVDEYKALIVDFESPRATQNVKKLYPSLKSHFTVMDVIVSNMGEQTQVNNVSKKDMFADFMDIGIDWRASLYQLRDTILPYLRDNTQSYNFLIADGLLAPAIKFLGEARFNELNDRDDPNQLDRVEIGKLETIVFRAFRIAAQSANIPLICTGKMKDIYEKSEKGGMERTGQITFYCNKEVYSDLTLALELQKPTVMRKSTNSNRFTVNCYKASAPGGFSWRADLIPGLGGEGTTRQELFDILLANGEIEPLEE